MASKSRSMQITKYNSNSTTSSARYNRAKVIIYKFTKQSISELIHSTTTIGFLHKISKPHISTRLLLRQQLISKGLTLIDAYNTMQEGRGTHISI